MALRSSPLLENGGLSKAGGTPKPDRIREASHYWFPELFPRVVDLQFLEGDSYSVSPGVSAREQGAGTNGSQPIADD